MGEKKRRLERLLAQQPMCIYCGGTTRADSCDHCPPIGIFDGRRRPQGLEFSACHECHEGTRQIDHVASALSRLYPEPVTAAQRTELVGVARGFVNNYPSLAARIFGDADETIIYDGKPANLMHIGDVAELYAAMNAFAARLGLALFYQERNQIVPPTAPIVCRWYSNYELASGEGPEELVQAMGSPKTLVMGRQHVFPQFRYWSATTSDNPAMFGCFAVFRESFATFAGIDVARGLDAFESAHRPGFLKGFSL